MQLLIVDVYGWLMGDGMVREMNVIQRRRTKSQSTHRNQQREMMVMMMIGCCETGVQVTRCELRWRIPQSLAMKSHVRKREYALERSLSGIDVEGWKVQLMVVLVEEGAEAQIYS